MVYSVATSLHLREGRVGSLVRGCLCAFLVGSGLVCICPPSPAQESPYIVTYDHYLEEPGNLDVEYFSTFATQRSGNDFHAL